MSGLNAGQTITLGKIGNGDADQLQSYIDKINEIKNLQNTALPEMTQEMFDASIPERYAKALSDLSSEQAALLMSTQGLSNEQIRQALAARTLEGSTETLTVAQQYQAMADAGLLKSKQTLTTAEVTEALQTTLGADADAEATLAAMGLATATDAEGNSTVKLTAKKLQAAVADGVLTEAQAQQLGMTLGVTAAVNTQANSTLPKWIVSLKASALVIWENVKATAAWLATSPVGWCILAGTAVFSLVKIVDALTVSLGEATNALEDAQNNYDTAKSQVESYSSQIKDLTDRINELQKLADNGTISVTEQEELDSLKAQNEELDRNIRLQEEKQRLASIEASDSAHDALNAKVKSDYVTGYDSFGEEIHGTTTVQGELQSAIAEYNKLQEAIDVLNTSFDQGQIEPEEYEKRLKSLTDQQTEARERANEMYEITLASETAYEDLKNAGEDLNDQQKEEYASVQQSNSAYLNFTDSIRNNTNAIKENTDAKEENSTTSFSFDTYKDSIDNVQSSITDLKSSLASLNKGEMTQENVLDLLQKFPSLVPYVDLAADGFGNLAQGLQELINQSPTTLINELMQLKEGLQTDEERQQIDALIDSLQRLSTYGDTGTEAYATAIGSTWESTENVIEGVTTQFENLAKVQEAVANGLTMSTDAAMELAKIYPEILTNAEYAANGQITLNDEVVKNILAGDSSQIDAQIAKLEADKAVLTAKKSFAEAQLNMAKQVGEGEGQITQEVAKYRLDIANKLLQQLIDAGVSEDEAYAAVAANMAGNMDEYNRIVGNVAQDTATNMDAAAVQAAKSIDINTVNSQKSWQALKNKIGDVADAIKAAPSGEKAGSDTIYSAGGSSSIGGIKLSNNSGNFKTTTVKNDVKQLDLDAFKSGLEVDIKGYTDAIANIDGQIEVLKNLQKTFDKTKNSSNGGIGGHDYSNKIKDLEKEKEKLNNATKDGTSGSEDTYDETIDFFEQRIKVLQQSLDILDKSMENVLGSKHKNQLLSAQSGIVSEEMNNYTDALAMYQKKADEALSQIDSSIRDQVVNGSVSITEFIGKGNEDTVKAIQNYQNWAEKVGDCKEQLAELAKKLREIELSKFNNIVDEYTDKTELFTKATDNINKQIDLFEEAGQIIGEGFYDAQKQNSQRQLNLLEEEKSRLVKQLNESLSSGRLTSGSDEWLEMVGTLSELDGSIIDCKKSIEEMDNAILNLRTEELERVQTAFSNIRTELENVVDLLDDADVALDDGSWTSEGVTKLGLLAQQYETARLQAQEYGKQIDELNANYLAGKYSATEYAEKLADLTQNQYDAINAYRDAEDAIMDVNQSRVDIMTDAINKETEAYNELIQAKLDALSAEKDLYEYRNSISEKNKSITDIERQLAAISNDDSAAAKAQKAKLQEQLDEARKDIADYEYDHDIEQRQDALNKEKDDYEKSQQQRIDSLNAYIENRDQVISDSFESVKANTSTVADELTQIAQEHGVKISNTITSAWNQGSNAIASYGQTLSAQSSVFLGNLLTVQNGIYALSAEANNTANSLGYMFSTSANTLLSELQSSYDSVGNVNTASQALKDSLVNTLERGYNINSITKGLNSIADSASSAASSVRDLNNALSGGSGGGSGSYVSDSNNSAEDHYRIVDPRYKKSKESKYILVDNLRDDAKLRKYMEKYRDQLHSGNLIIQRYAKGGIVTKEKDNPFNTIAQSVGEDTMIAAKEGESVLTKDQTKGIQSLAENISKPNRTDPITIDGKTYYKVTDYDIPLKKLDEQISQMKADGIDTDAWLKSMTMNKHMFYMDTDLPTIEKTTVQQPVNIQVGNMVEVQGSLDSATMPQVEKAIAKGINNLGVKLTKQLRYGGT